MIDDDDALRRAFHRLLRSRYEMTSVASGDEALAIIREGARFDVILCDLNLAGLSGRELCQELVRIAPGQVRRIVAHTAAALDDADDFLRIVSGRMLHKPSSAAAIDAVVSSMLADSGRAA